jgi:hypothetical protein
MKDHRLSDEVMPSRASRFIFSRYLYDISREAWSMEPLEWLVNRVRQPQVVSNYHNNFLTPFPAMARNMHFAETSPYHALVFNHPRDQDIRSIYDPFTVSYLAYTGTRYRRPEVRWNVVIPLASEISYDRFVEITNGIVSALSLDPGRHTNPVFFPAPNRPKPKAIYRAIDETDSPLLDGKDDTHPLIKMALKKAKRRA